MDSQHTRIAADCLNAAYDGTMSFPQIVATLLDAGFEGYLVDYRRNAVTYYHSNGESVTLDNRHGHAGVADRFDRDGVAAQIRWAQSGAADYGYASFCENVKALGCAGYIVSFPGRRVVYFGRTAETHVEHFPQ